MRQTSSQKFSGNSDIKHMLLNVAVVFFWPSINELVGWLVLILIHRVGAADYVTTGVKPLTPYELGEVAPAPLVLMNINPSTCNA